MSRALSAALVGVEGVPIEVEVRISALLPRIDIVGLPTASVRESAARVRAAITAAGHRFPDRRVTVNLAPAALRKDGAALDLPIAMAVLAAAGSLPLESLEGCAFVGELALDGRLRPVRGALALVVAARDAGCRDAIVPAANAAEAALAPGITVRAARDLSQVVAHLLGAEVLSASRPPLRLAEAQEDGRGELPCLADVRGQQQAKRALEVAAVGGHGILLIGPPGSGKTMLARRLTPLLPPLGFDEALEATRIHGAAGLLNSNTPLVATRPFRAPHHTASSAGLLGGGNPPRPGEVSLAHRGVLFLDELPEFERRALEALRQVLEEGRVRLARAGHVAVFPANFQLVAACNPCPCGFWGSALHDCRCDDGAVARYAQKLSGPLLDRIDLQVRVPALAWAELDRSADARAPQTETSSAVAARVREARSRGPLARIARPNAAIPDSDLDSLVAATAEARTLLGRAVDRLGLSARGARRALRVARSVADLSHERKVGPQAMAEALGYRAVLPEARDRDALSQ